MRSNCDDGIQYMAIPWLYWPGMHVLLSINIYN